MGEGAGWARVPAVLPGQGAAHGRLRAAGRHPDAPLVGHARGGRAVGRASKPRTASLGFAWLALGNAGIDMGLPMRLAPFTGVYGLSFVFAMMATALALAVLRPAAAGTAVAGCRCLLLIFLPPLPDAQPGRETAAAGAAQHLRRPRSGPRNPSTACSASWPRSRCAAPWPAAPTSALDRGLAGSARAALLRRRPALPRLCGRSGAGHPRLSADGRGGAHARRARRSIRPRWFRPTGVSRQPLRQGEPGAVRRVRAVAVRLRSRDKISTEAGDFAAGQAAWWSRPWAITRSARSSATNRCSPISCASFAAGGAEVLFNISNDGWFGKSAARCQHLEIVRMRAAENRRWILRSDQRRHHRHHRSRRPSAGHAAAICGSGVAHWIYVYQ